MPRSLISAMVTRPRARGGAARASQAASPRAASGRPCPSVTDTSNCAKWSALALRASGARAPRGDCRGAVAVALALALAAVRFVGFHDLLHERMADHVTLVEV